MEALASTPARTPATDKKSNKQKNETNAYEHEQKRQQTYNSIRYFLSEQLPVVISAVALSISLYRLAPIGLYKLSQLWPGTRLAEAQHSASMEAMQIIYDEVIALRRDTLDIQTHLADRQLTEQRLMEYIQEKESVAPKSFGMNEFPSLFRIEPSSVMEIDPAIAKYFENYDLKKDPAYLDAKKDLDAVSADYGSMIEVDYSKDARFSIRWNVLREKYGLYATVPLPANTFLGVFAGVITDTAADLSQTWKYRGSITNKDGEPVNLIIDGQKKGNWFQFLQIDSLGNVEAFFLPHKNQWYIGFRTLRSVQADEELLLSVHDLKQQQELLEQQEQQQRSQSDMENEAADE